MVELIQGVKELLWESDLTGPLGWFLRLLAWPISKPIGFPRNWIFGISGGIQLYAYGNAALWRVLFYEGPVGPIVFSNLMSAPHDDGACCVMVDRSLGFGRKNYQ